MKKISKVFLTLLLFVSMVGVPLYAMEGVDQTGETATQEVSDESTSVKEVLQTDTPIGSADLEMISSSETIEVGNIAQFQMYIMLNGMQENYKNVVVTVSLPTQVDNKQVIFNQEMSELSIRGVIPTYDSQLNQLKYNFQEIDGGFESSKLINISTVNGSPLDGEELVVKAEISADNITPVTAESSTTLVANQNASITNKIKGIACEGNIVDRLSIRYLDEATFSVGASVNKFTSGSLALKEGSKVVIHYALAEGLTYVSDTSGVTPTFDGVAYTWEFDSNLNEDGEYFFVTNFDITTKVEGDLTLFSKIENKMTTEIEYVDSTMKTFDATASVMVSANFGYINQPFLDGDAFTSVFSGPKDGLGNVGWINNDDPSVTDGAILGWGFYLTPIYATSPNYGMDSYNIFFHPDENTNLNQIYTGKYFFRPNNKHNGGKLAPMEDPIYISVKIKYTDSEEWFEGKADLRDETFYTASGLGINTSKKVKTLWLHYHNNEKNIFWDNIGAGNGPSAVPHTIPAGLTSQNMRFYTTIDDGYVGSIESKLGVGVSGWEGSVNPSREDYYSSAVPSELVPSYFNKLSADWESRLTPKTAQVVEAPTGISRYIRSNAYFATAKNNLLSKGDNTLRLEIVNDSASLRQLVGPFETYVLVDQGVEFPDLSATLGAEVSLVDSNYNNTGKSLLKVVLPHKSMSIGSKASVLIPVTITEQAPYKLNIEYIGYYGEDFDVSIVSNTNGTFTVKEKDILDFNGSGAEEDVYVARNSYTLTDAYEFYAQLGVFNESSVTNVTNFYDLDTSTVQLSLNNPLGRPISTVNLIGTLPDVGDTFVLNDEAMNSKFAMNLTGAIKLPEAYKDSFKVYYSTSKEPLVAGVLDVNTSDRLSKLEPTTLVDDQEWLAESEVTDFSLMRSYKIVMKSGVKPISDEVINFELNLEIADHSLTGEEAIANRIAYMSYAVGINDATVFETQTVNFIYNVKPVYEIIANDVTMKLSDVNRMAKEGTLMSYILGQAGVVVTKNGIAITDPSVLIHFANLETEYAVGMYDLLYVYSTGEGKDGAMTIARLNIVADDASIADAPKLPSTGMGQNYFGMSLLALGSIALMANLLNKKRKHTN